MPTDTGKRCWRTAAMSLSARRIQADGVDNKVLSPCAVSEDSYNSWHGKSDKCSVCNSPVETML